MGKSLVLEWQTVTVALFHFNNSATGVPTILDLPRTTALAPEIATPLLKFRKKSFFGLFNSIIINYGKILIKNFHLI